MGRTSRFHLCNQAPVPRVVIAAWFLDSEDFESGANLCQVWQSGVTLPGYHVKEEFKLSLDNCDEEERTTHTQNKGPS
jgi:hypothetical protein